LNIALVDNLLTVVQQLGLSEVEAREVLVTRRFRDAVDADWRRCRKLGINAVPTFVVGDEGVVGAQSYNVLERLILAGGAVRR